MHAPICNTSHWQWPVCAYISQVPPPYIKNWETCSLSTTCQQKICLVLFLWNTPGSQTIVFHVCRTGANRLPCLGCRHGVSLLAAGTLADRPLYSSICDGENMIRISFSPVRRSTTHSPFRNRAIWLSRPQTKRHVYLWLRTCLR